MLEDFIYAKQKSLFEEALNNGEVLDEAIVFIEDTKEIWTHGVYFGGGASEANVQAVDTEDIVDDVNIEYTTKAYVDGLVEDINSTIGDINSVLESIING